MRVTPRLQLVVAVVVLAAAILAGCAPGPNPSMVASEHATAGFGLGLWHGIIVWVTFFWSLFDPHVSIYEVHNGGWPYNLGFVIGAACFHGGGIWGGSRRRRG